MDVDSSDKARGSIQVICLGSGGGPSEDNVTAFLVRSQASGWSKGSILAIDAGSHLAAITRMLNTELPLVSRTQRRADSEGNVLEEFGPVGEASPLSSPATTPRELSPQAPLEPICLKAGPFAGVPLPFLSARANAAHIVRNHVSTYLITHPHLDHLAGFAINTAAFHATSRPKRLAALPFTVDAIKKHIFNDVIWPNLTDEDGGVGFVTFQRLKEGGDIMVGTGEGRGYIEVCEGLGAKGFKVSHGKCMHGGSSASSHRGSLPNIYDSSSKVGRSYDSQAHDSYGGLSDSNGFMLDSSASQHHASIDLGQTVDSTAYFIRDVATAREILVFGDVEPDQISITPRLARIWAEAAPKIASRILTGMFIECSYDDSHPDAVLFGHMAPRHLVQELRNLAEVVLEERAYRAAEKANRKRKRAANGSSLSYNVPVGQDIFSWAQKRSRSYTGRPPNSPYRRASVPHPEPTYQHHIEISRQTPSPTPLRMSGMTPEFAGLSAGTASTSSRSQSQQRGGLPRAVSFGSGIDPAGLPVEPPLAGLRVIIIHIKDTLTDGPHVSERILAQLNHHAAAMKTEGEELGCTFEISESGQDYWF